MRIVVTGAAGFIGSHLSERLLAAGHEVRGLDSFTRFYARAHKEANLAEVHRAPGFRLYEDTASTPEGLARAFAGADAVCHLAGRPGVRGGAPHAFEEANVRTTESVLSAASAAGARRVILASSSSVYGPADAPVAEDAPLRPLSHYGRSKLRAERVAGRKAEKLGTRAGDAALLHGLRPPPAARHGVRPLRRRRAGRRRDGGAGRRRPDARLHLRRPTPATRPWPRWSAGARAPPTTSPAAARPRWTQALTLLGASLGAAARLTPAPADGREPRSTAADLARARDELGWEPAVALAAGLDLQAAHARTAALAV